MTLNMPFKVILRSFWGCFLMSGVKILYYGSKGKRSPVKRSNRESGLSYICDFAENEQPSQIKWIVSKMQKCLRRLCILQLHGKPKRLISGWLRCFCHWRVIGSQSSRCHILSQCSFKGKRSPVKRINRESELLYICYFYREWTITFRFSESCRKWKTLTGDSAFCSNMASQTDWMSTGCKRLILA